MLRYLIVYKVGSGHGNNDYRIMSDVFCQNLRIIHITVPNLWQPAKQS
jgi:hypothetical protein